MTKSVQILMLEKALFLIKSVNKKLDDLNEKHAKAKENNDYNYQEVA